MGASYISKGAKDLSIGNSFSTCQENKILLWLSQCKTSCSLPHGLFSFLCFSVVIGTIERHLENDLSAHLELDRKGILKNPVSLKWEKPVYRQMTPYHSCSAPFLLTFIGQGGLV